jgi:crossover junction endodeoxyribonuclease RuvC
MMTLEKYSISAVEYTPIVVKQTITGYGRASKDEVARSVEQMVEKDGKNWPKLDDTVDSIAIAVCHARNEECNLSQYAV